MYRSTAKSLLSQLPKLARTQPGTLSSFIRLPVTSMASYSTAKKPYSTVQSDSSTPASKTYLRNDDKPFDFKLMTRKIVHGEDVYEIHLCRQKSYRSVGDFFIKFFVTLAPTDWRKEIMINFYVSIDGANKLLKCIKTVQEKSKKNKTISQDDSSFVDETRGVTTTFEVNVDQKADGLVIARKQSDKDKKYIFVLDNDIIPQFENFIQESIDALKMYRAGKVVFAKSDEEGNILKEH